MRRWINALRDLEAHAEAYVIVTLLGVRGSAPRDCGAKMLVAEQRIFATIGGGHLEFKAIEIARKMLRGGEDSQRIETFPLGARLGQCCGGSVTVLFECFAATQLNIMLFGAGHVGRALVTILEHLPCRLWWVDSRQQEFPERAADRVTRVLSDTPADEVNTMPAGSYYLVMTHSHALDFDITEAIIKRGDARYAGLIGSQSKWRRFRMRFEQRGYGADQYTQLRCPVGLAAVPGKLPMEVATAIAGEIIAEYQGEQSPQQTIGQAELKAVMGIAAKPAQAEDIPVRLHKPTAKSPGWE